jgi:cellobiose dehydrogenase (acceptor)
MGARVDQLPIRRSLSRMLGHSLLSALALAGVALAQQEVTYTDASGLPFSGLYDSQVDSTFGFLFPTSTTGTEFIGEFIVPITQKWAGVALGGGMNNDLLIVAWPNGNSIVSTPRFTTYGPYSIMWYHRR